jgi:hypothetical protein
MGVRERERERESGRRGAEVSMVQAAGQPEELRIEGGWRKRGRKKSADAAW